MENINTQIDKSLWAAGRVMGARLHEASLGSAMERAGIQDGQDKLDKLAVRTKTVRVVADHAS